MKLILIILFALFISPTSKKTKVQIDFFVVDAVNGKPIANADIIENGKTIAKTDNGGHRIIEKDAGYYQFDIRANFYKAKTEHDVTVSETIKQEESIELYSVNAFMHNLDSLLYSGVKILDTTKAFQYYLIILEIYDRSGSKTELSTFKKKYDKKINDLTLAAQIPKIEKDFQ